MEPEAMIRNGKSCIVAMQAHNAGRNGRGGCGMDVPAKSRYHEVYARSLRDPQGFWGEAAQEIDWYQPAKTVFDGGAGVYGRWFVGASCNTCYNAIDRHVASGRGEQTALIYDSPVTNTIRTY